MAILKIARMGHPTLKGIAEKVADPTTSEIHNLIKDMRETMEDAGGVGLAAPQVGVCERILVAAVPIRDGVAEEAEGEDGSPE